MTEGVTFNTENIIGKQQNPNNEEKSSPRRSLIYPLIQDLPDNGLLEGSRRDLQISKFIVKNVISEIEDAIIKKEEQRDYKMKSKINIIMLVDFEREKEFILNQQAEVKNKIEHIQINNTNERMINFYKEEKSNQQDLFNKYFTLNSEVIAKTKKISEILPDLELKVKKKRDKLKDINQENLRLMEKISQLEKEKSRVNSNISYNNNIQNIIESFDNKMNDSNNKTIISKFKDNFNNFNTNNVSINITDIIEESEFLKEKFNYIQKLKMELRQLKKENKLIIDKTTEMNTLYFVLIKIFTEGMHELSKELLKIHEIQLDKVVSSKSIKIVYYLSNIFLKVFLFLIPSVLPEFIPCSLCIH